MAKELKTKLVLELDDFSRKLTKAERDAKKTIASIERESGRGMASIRADLLGGIGAGNSVREMQAYKQEQRLASRSGREQFDAQIGGGMFAAQRSTFVRDMEATNRSFVDLAAKAWAAKKAIRTTFSVGSAAVKAFRGDVDGARKALEEMPITGWANKAGFKLGEWFVDKYVEKDVYSNRDRALTELAQNEKRAKYDQEQIRKRQDFEAATRRMLYDTLLANADPETAARIRAQQFREDEMAALARSGMNKESKEYKSREAAINIAASRMVVQAQIDESLKAEKEAEAKQREVAQLESDIAVSKLQAAGKTQEAELLGIRESGRRKAEEYRRQKNEVAAVKQEELTALEVAARKKELLEADEAKRADAMARLTEARGRDAEARGAADRSYTASGNTALISSSLTRSPGSGFEQTLRGQVDIAKRSYEVLQGIRRAVERLQSPQLIGV